MNWRDNGGEIVRAMGERGGLDKPAGEVLALQVAEMVEKIYRLGEDILDHPVAYPGIFYCFYDQLNRTSEFARALFDSGSAGSVTAEQQHSLRVELADITIVVYIMWAALGELAGIPFSPNAEAYRRARTISEANDDGEKR